MQMPTVTGAEAGDAFVVGGYLPCVLLTDAGPASPYNATVQTEGVFDISVYAHDGSVNSAVSVGDLLYWTDKDTALNKDTSEDPFGVALEAVSAGETDTINVLLVPKSTLPNSVGTSDIEAKAVTLAKTADLAQGSIISGQASNRPTALDAKGDGKILVGDGTDVNSVAVSGDATMANTGAVSLSDHTVKYAEKTFSAAEIKTLYSANTNKGLEIVAAPGAGKLIEFISASLWYDYDGTNAYTAANGLTFNVDNVAVSDTIGATFLQATADQVSIVQALSAEIIDAAADVLNKALYLQEGTTNPTGSATTAADQLLVKVAYRVHDFS